MHNISIGMRLEQKLMRYFLGIDSKLRDYHDKISNFEKVQKETLEKIIRQNEDSAWGKSHCFKKTDSSSWHKQPIVTYAEVESYVERIKEGSMNELTSENPIAFVKTSGTTSLPKYIPVTPKSLESHMVSELLWKVFLVEKHAPSLAKVLFLTSFSGKENYGALPVSSYTSLVKKKQPWYVKKRFIFPEICESVTDFDHRLLIAAQECFINPPGMVVAVNPLTIERMLDLAERERDVLFKSVVQGLYVGTRYKFRSSKEACERAEKANPFESVGLIGTWLGGTQHFFIKKIRDRGIKATMRDIGYMATEGRFTIVDEDETPAGTLNPYNLYVEFMQNQEIVPIKDLEKGKEYRVVVTGFNGLYRYNMEDIVEFQGFNYTAPKISFKRKSECFSSMTGEKIHENHVASVFKDLGLDKGFLVADLNNTRYVFVCEVSNSEISPEVLDFKLQEVNQEYSEKRNTRRLKNVEVRKLNSEDFGKVYRLVHRRLNHDRFKQKLLIPPEKSSEILDFTQTSRTA